MHAKEGSVVELPHCSGTGGATPVGSVLSVRAARDLRIQQLQSVRLCVVGSLKAHLHDHCTMQAIIFKIIVKVSMFCFRYQYCCVEHSFMSFSKTVLEVYSVFPCLLFNP